MEVVFFSCLVSGVFHFAHQKLVTFIGVFENSLALITCSTDPRKGTQLESQTQAALSKQLAQAPCSFLAKARKRCQRPRNSLEGVGFVV